MKANGKGRVFYEEGIEHYHFEVGGHVELGRDQPAPGKTINGLLRCTLVKPGGAPKTLVRNGKVVRISRSGPVIRLRNGREIEIKQWIEPVEEAR